LEKLTQSRIERAGLTGFEPEAKKSVPYSNKRPLAKIKNLPLGEE
jgi:hypothetical protein